MESTGSCILLNKALRNEGRTSGSSTRGSSVMFLGHQSLDYGPFLKWLILLMFVFMSCTDVLLLYNLSILRKKAVFPTFGARPAQNDHWGGSRPAEETVVT